MNRWGAAAAAGTAAVLLGLAVWGCFGLTRVAYIAIEKWGNAAPAPHAIDPTLKHLDAATGAWAASSAQQGAAILQIERDIRVDTWHADRLMTTTDAQLARLGPMLDAYRAVPDHLNAAADSATSTISAMKAPIARTDRLVEDLDASAQSANALLKDQAIYRILDNAAGMTDSGDRILLDGRKVADKATDDYLKPVRWYMVPFKRAGELWDIGAAIARHTP